MNDRETEENETREKQDEVSAKHKVLKFIKKKCL